MKTYKIEVTEQEYDTVLHALSYLATVAIREPNKIPRVKTMLQSVGGDRCICMTDPKDIIGVAAKLEDQTRSEREGVN